MKKLENTFGNACFKILPELRSKKKKNFLLSDGTGFYKQNRHVFRNNSIVAYSVFSCFDMVCNSFWRFIIDHWHTFVKMRSV